MSAIRNYGERGLHSGVNSLGGFKKFILRGNVVDLAVGIVIGAAFTGVVTAFTRDFITPLIGVFGVHNLASTVIHGPHGNNFNIGDFINVVIAFLITAFIVYYFVVLPVNRLNDRYKSHEATTPTTRECPFCLSSVPLKAMRCAYCTAQLPPVEVSPINHNYRQ